MKLKKLVTKILFSIGLTTLMFASAYAIPAISSPTTGAPAIRATESCRVTLVNLTTSVIKDYTSGKVAQPAGGRVSFDSTICPLTHTTKAERGSNGVLVSPLFTPAQVTITFSGNITAPATCDNSCGIGEYKVCTSWGCNCYNCSAK